MTAEKKEKNIQSKRLLNLFKLTKMLKPFRFKMMIAIISGIGHQIFIAAVAMMGAIIVGCAIDGTLLSRWENLISVFTVLIVLYIVFYFLEMWFAHDVAFGVLADFRIKLFAAIEKVSPAIILNMRSGQLASTLMSDVELLEWFFAHSFGSMIVAATVTIIFTIFLGTIWWGFVPLVIMFVFIAITIPVFLKKKADIQGAEVRNTLGEANAVTMEGVQGLKEILTLNYREAYLKKNKSYMDRLYEGQLSYGKRLGTEGAMLKGNIGISMLTISIAASILCARGNLEPAVYPAVVMLASMVLGPVTEICNTARNFGLIFAAADRVYNVLEKKPLVKDEGKDIPISEIEPEVLFDHVSFSYNNDGNMAVKHVSFKIKAGETVAITGESGAGKSTCMKLLMRYWDPEEGTVSIGGRDIKSMSQDTLHKLISVVLQDVYLFRESIKENIRLGNRSASDEDIIRAAKIAKAHDFIMELPDGYDTVAGEAGLKLSGGQRQRIAIARALIHDAPVILMDEAVSNLDAANENSIQKEIKKSCRGKTIIMVAHRQSTLANADRIIRLEHGMVMEEERSV